MKRVTLVSAIAIFFVLLVAAAGPSLAATAAFVKFDGVDGEARDNTHKGWNDLASFSQSIHKPGSGTGATRRRGSVVLEDISLTKELDKASPKLAEAICKGKVFPKVEIHLVSGGTTYYAYELTNVRITDYSVTGAESPGAAPVEQLSLNFEQIKVTYTELDDSGRPKGNVEFEWKKELATR